MTEAQDPSVLSSDQAAMQGYLSLASAIRGGVDTMRAAGTRFLPQFARESDEAYESRVQNARMTNIFEADIVADLAQRPFTRNVMIGKDMNPQLAEFAADDVDRRGNDLHVFGGRIFKAAIRDGITWVLVDYPGGPSKDRTVAEEKALGLRPFWAHYRAADVIAVYSEFRKGQEVITEARLREERIERDGFAEKKIKQIRVLKHPMGGKPTWEMWEEDTKKNTVAPWARVTEPQEMDIDSIPLIPIILGDREGASWRYTPPLRDAAHLQVELYQQENGLKHVRLCTAYPMLAANGIDEPAGKDKTLEVGPNRVLYGGMSEHGAGSWNYVEPSGASLQFLREDISDTIKELRELGRQPLASLTSKTGSLTVITTAVAAKKGNTVIQAWVRMLHTAIQRMFDLTAQWLDIADPQISFDIHTEFDLGFGDDASFNQVLELGGGDYPLISREAVLDEAKRRGILRPEYNEDADVMKLGEAEPPEA